jgi:hypothetical protein
MVGNWQEARVLFVMSRYEINFCDKQPSYRKRNYGRTPPGLQILVPVALGW